MSSNFEPLIQETQFVPVLSEILNKPKNNFDFDKIYRSFLEETYFKENMYFIEVDELENEQDLLIKKRVKDEIIFLKTMNNLEKLAISFVFVFDLKIREAEKKFKKIKSLIHYFQKIGDFEDLMRVLGRVYNDVTQHLLNNHIKTSAFEYF